MAVRGLAFISPQANACKMLIGKTQWRATMDALDYLKLWHILLIVISLLVFFVENSNMGLIEIMLNTEHWHGVTKFRFWCEVWKFSAPGDIDTS
jgi:hypothetical protein